MYSNLLDNFNKGIFNRSAVPETGDNNDTLLQNQITDIVLIKFSLILWKYLKMKINLNEFNG
jgi:hypothetical protein